MKPNWEPDSWGEKKSYNLLKIKRSNTNDKFDKQEIGLYLHIDSRNSFIDILCQNNVFDAKITGKGWIVYGNNKYIVIDN